MSWYEVYEIISRDPAYVSMEVDLDVIGGTQQPKLHTRHGSKRRSRPRGRSVRQGNGLVGWKSASVATSLRRWITGTCSRAICLP